MMGFSGKLLTQNYLYFSLLPPSSADFFLSKMIQSKNPRNRPC